MVKVKVFSLVKDKGVGVINTFDKTQSLRSASCEQMLDLIKSSMLECGLNPAKDLALVVTWDYEFMDSLVEELRKEGKVEGITNLAFFDLKTRQRSKQSLINYVKDFALKTPKILDQPNFPIHSFTYHVNHLYGDMKATQVTKLYEQILPHRVI